MAYALEDYLDSYTKGSGSGGSRVVDKSSGSRDPTSRWGTFVSQQGDCLHVTSRVTSPYLLLERYEADSWLKRLGGATAAQRIDVIIYGDGVVHIDAKTTSADEEAVDRWRAYALGAGAALGFGSVGTWGSAAAARAVEKLIERRVARRTETLPEPATAEPALVDAVAPTEAVVHEAQTADDASVSAVASRIAELSDLSDQQLADLFRVERETYCRWRTGALTNPRLGNRQRLALLERLMEDLAQRTIPVKDWLLNRIAEDGKTPYELLRQGRIDRVALLALADGGVSAGGGAIRSVAEAEAAGELTFEDDNEWDYPDENEAEYPGDGNNE